MRISSLAQDYSRRPPSRRQIVDAVYRRGEVHGDSGIYSVGISFRDGALPTHDTNSARLAITVD